VAEGNGGGLVRLDDFEGELDEEWQGARGGKVFDKNGEEVGTVEEIYVWGQAEAAHLIKAEVDGQHVLIPTDAVTTVTDEGVEVEETREVILESPGHDSDEVPDPETVGEAYAHYGYTDQISLGTG